MKTRAIRFVDFALVALLMSVTPLGLLSTRRINCLRTLSLGFLLALCLCVNSVLYGVKSLNLLVTFLFAT